MAIFHGYVKLPEGTWIFHGFSTSNCWFTGGWWGDLQNSRPDGDGFTERVMVNSPSYLEFTEA